MIPTCGYAILEEGTRSGSRYWVTLGGSNRMIMVAAARAQPCTLYADRAAAERDAELLRLRNLRDVERSRWRPSFRTELATYTLIELTSEMQAECERSAPVGEVGSPDSPRLDVMAYHRPECSRRPARPQEAA